MLPLYHSPIYTSGLDPKARFPRERYDLVKSRLTENSTINFLEPSPLDHELILLAHDERYATAFLEGTLDLKAARRIGLTPWTKEIVERTLILTNGTVSAMRDALGGAMIAGNLGGGTHHAYHDFGSGYCIFNDLAIAARAAQRDHGIERVLILDLDVHQGDGTAAIFEDDASVRTISFHCGKNFPFRKMTSDLDVVFDEGVSDDFYLERLEDVLAREIEQFQPQLVLFQAGVDTLATDRLGHLALSRDGLQRRNEMVFRAMQANATPTVITMGGGYGEPIKTSVAAHVDLFNQAAQSSIA